MLFPSLGVYFQTLQVAGDKTGVGFPTFSLSDLGNGGGGNLDV